MVAQHQVTKEVVSVAEMARMVGLSRQRFYQLQGSCFPPPLYDIATRKPFYTRELQATCLEVRQRNCGINGKAVLFYARRGEATPTTRRPPKQSPPGQDHSELVAALKSLGLSVTAAQVGSAWKELFPQGTRGVDPGAVIRSLFLQLKRQNAADNVGR